MYQQKAPANGRNNALFQVSILARDQGYSLDQTITILTHAHVTQKPNERHPYQSTRQRKREAEATIRSAYKRPARPQTAATTSEQLPNPVREALMQRKAMFVLRTLDALRLVGIQPGQTFTKKEALALLSGIIGKDSVLNTFHLILAGGQPLLEPIVPPAPPKYTAEEEPVGQLQTNALRGQKKPAKIKKGRKPTYFIMPDNAELAQRLQVKHRAISDVLPMEALKSARRTRLTLHSRFIERKPGMYPMKFLAKRLGMTPRTIQNYHALTPEIKREAVFSRQPISWHNLNLIPDELPHGGFFLTDNAGKKYPAKVGIAQRLLGQKRVQLTLNRQMPNLYWYGDSPKPFGITAIKEALDQQYEMHRQKQREWAMHRLRERDTLAASPTIATTPVPTTLPLPGISPPPAQQRLKPPAPPKKRKVSGKRCLKNPDEEAAAHHLRDMINQMTTDRAGRVSLLRARRIVARYGRTHTLDVLRRVQKRAGVRKPVGLLCTILRSEQKFQGVHPKK